MLTDLHRRCLERPCLSAAVWWAERAALPKMSRYPLWLGISTACRYCRNLSLRTTCSILPTWCKRWWEIEKRFDWQLTSCHSSSKFPCPKTLWKPLRTFDRRAYSLFAFQPITSRLFPVVIISHNLFWVLTLTKTDYTTVCLETTIQCWVWGGGAWGCMVFPNKKWKYWIFSLIHKGKIDT